MTSSNSCVGGSLRRSYRHPRYVTVSVKKSFPCGRKSGGRGGARPPGAADFAIVAARRQGVTKSFHFSRSGARGLLTIVMFPASENVWTGRVVVS